MKNDPYPTKQTADSEAHRQSLPSWGDLEGYYHSDHLGSSSWITDQDGEAIQHLQYLPFGEQYIDQRTTGWDAMFTFSGKERDQETGYSYFGARYYDSDLSIWLSVDPLAHRSPHQSPYVYCSNNPICRIDPLGKIDYEVGENGHIVEKNTFFGSIKKFFGIKDKQDRLIAANGKTLSMKSGTMSKIYESKKGNKIKGHYFDVSDNESADQVYDFLSENTNVEWGRTEGSSSTGESFNIISTSHSKTENSIISGITTTLLDKGHAVTTSTHSHLDGSLPSGYAPGHVDSNDKNFVDHLNKYYPQDNITHKVYDVKNKQYIYYNADGIYKYEKK